ncbi:cyclic lactone autoinducer peptide [Candidatus Contubernalis alkaliaceticus]|nr:cyclic lactone autoinducer peptide [Candidatus Contubernalis alkalaceticus]UNC93030.1 cyclic lactone autoinducer peptide [Candidatus Contubernalis alkalaceticus]
MKRTLILLSSMLAFLLTLVANAGAASASWWFSYEPEMPTKLKR